MSEEIDYKTAYENVMVANDMLRKEYDKLKKEIKEIKEGTRPVISPYHGDAYITHEMEYHERKRLEQENKELHNKIDKAIELTKRQLLSNSNYTGYTDEMCLKDLLEILKDSDVDE